MELNPNSNTLAAILAMAEGHVLDIKMMPFGKDKVALHITPTPIKGELKVESLPPIKVTVTRDNLDKLAYDDIQSVFQGELADRTQRLSAIAKSLAEKEEELLKGKDKDKEKTTGATPAAAGTEKGGKKAAPKAGDLFKAPEPEPAPAPTPEAPAAEADEDEGDW